MTRAVIIPARFESSRFPGKPLVELRGSDGVSKSLVQRAWEAGCAAAPAEAVWVATDDDRIADAVRAFGGQVLMTSSACRNGTERCAEALAMLPERPDIVVNLQGDAPLTPPWFVTDVADALDAAPAEFGMATPVLLTDPDAQKNLRDDRKADRVGGTTAVFGADMRGLYFSKEVLPFAGDPDVPVYHHVGLYAYRPDALERYSGWPEGALEKTEGLEQLRFLEQGEPVLCVKVEARGRVFWELNNPVDIERIEAVL
ncbi:MAG: 3-deoxy-manno-octulosonate cytidylyltransferase [Rhodobacteraceae bacterium]|nr:3-deoxy-manno-octulosonate cytidylyltransferase [Paracoccaceae bacterium]